MIPLMAILSQLKIGYKGSSKCFYYESCGSNVDESELLSTAEQFVLAKLAFNNKLGNVI
jgi:hypothetical protein